MSSQLLTSVGTNFSSAQINFYRWSGSLNRIQAGKFPDKELQEEADEEVDEEDEALEDVLQDGEEVEVDVSQGELELDQLYRRARYS